MSVGRRGELLQGVLDVIHDVLRFSRTLVAGGGLTVDKEGDVKNLAEVLNHVSVAYKMAACYCEGLGSTHVHTHPVFWQHATVSQTNPALLT